MSKCYRSDLCYKARFLKYYHPIFEKKLQVQLIRELSIGGEGRALQRRARAERSILTTTSAVLKILIHWIRCKNTQ